MGEILAFPSHVKAIGATRPATDGGARILFFLGVRYVRMDGERTTGAGAPRAGGGMARGGKKRKRRA